MTSGKELIELTQSITFDELMGFVSDKIKRPKGVEGDSFACPVCQSREWSTLPYPGSTNRPIITSHPIPYSKSQATWYFPLNCDNCGYTIFLDARIVATAISERRKS